MSHYGLLRNQIYLGRRNLEPLYLCLGNETAAINVDITQRLAPAEEVEAVVGDVPAVQQDQEAESCQGSQQEHFLVAHLAAVRQVQGFQIWHLLQELHGNPRSTP